MTREETWEAYENQFSVRTTLDGESVTGKIIAMLSNKTTRYDCKLKIGKNVYYAKASELEVNQ